MPRRVPLPPDLLGSPFAYSDGLDLGIGQHRLRGRDLDRPFHGVRAAAQPFRVEGDFDALLRRCREFAPLIVDGRYFSHETAARLWGCPLPTRWDAAAPIHVTAVAPLGRPRGRGVSGHAATGTAVVSTRHGLPVSDPASTWLELAGRVPRDELVAIGDHLLYIPAVAEWRDPRPYVSLETLVARTQASFGGRGVRAARAALPLLRIGAASRPETLLRLLLFRPNLPEPELNRDIHSASGVFLGRADLAWPRFRTIVEYDGDQHRTSTEQHERDISRVDGFIQDSWHYVRVRKHGLFVDRAGTIRRVHQALGRGGWRP